jgi:hypothetical protein
MSSDSDKSVILVRNPDGSFSEGLRPGYQFPKIPQTPPSDFEEAFFDPSLVFERHEGLFITLVMFELTLDSAGLVAESLHPELLGRGFLKQELVFKSEKIPVYWVIISLQAVFFLLFYGSAVLAVYFRKARFFGFFADLAIFGIMADATNFILGGDGLAELMLRCTALVYGRFLRRVLLSTQLVP